MKKEDSLKKCNILYVCIDRAQCSQLTWLCYVRHDALPRCYMTSDPLGARPATDSCAARRVQSSPTRLELLIFNVVHHSFLQIRCLFMMFYVTYISCSSLFRAPQVHHRFLSRVYWYGPIAGFREHGDGTSESLKQGNSWPA